MKKLLLFLLPLWLLAEAHIFVLHRIDDFRHPYTDTSSKELENYLKYIKSHGYKAVTLSKLAKMIQNKKDLNKTVVFTIDDTFKSFYKNGLPLFIKYHIPFTLFVYVKATDKKWGDFMNWQQVKKTAKYGELGIHSWAHPHLPSLSDEAITKDTEKAIKVFKKHLGYVPDLYAYPYGEYDNRVKKIISRFFNVIANQNAGAIDLSTPVNDLDRIALTGKVDIAKKLKLKRLHANIDVKRDKNTVLNVFGEVQDNIPYVNIYLTGFGWVYHVKVKNSHFSYPVNFRLKRYRNRVIIRYNNKIISKMIIKYK